MGGGGGRKIEDEEARGRRIGEGKDGEGDR